MSGALPYLQQLARALMIAGDGARVLSQGEIADLYHVTRLAIEAVAIEAVPTREQQEALADTALLALVRDMTETLAKRNAELKALRERIEGLIVRLDAALDESTLGGDVEYSKIMPVADALRAIASRLPGVSG